MSTLPPHPQSLETAAAATTVYHHGIMTEATETLQNRAISEYYDFYIFHSNFHLLSNLDDFSLNTEGENCDQGREEEELAAVVVRADKY